MNLPLSKAQQELKMLNSNEATEAICSLLWMESNPRRPDEDKLAYIKRCEMELQIASMFRGVATAALNHAIRRFYSGFLLDPKDWQDPTAMPEIRRKLNESVADLLSKTHPTVEQVADVCAAAAMMFYHAQTNSASKLEDATLPLPLNENPKTNG